MEGDLPVECAPGKLALHVPTSVPPGRYILMLGAPLEPSVSSWVGPASCRVSRDVPHALLGRKADAECLGDPVELLAPVARA
jgi:hypothetical protein